jgi:DNA repair protein RadD
MTSFPLRPRQQEMVKKAMEALQKSNNTLCIAPTGAGKTVILSHLLSQLLKTVQKALVLQHRQELIRQNCQTFQKIAPQFTTSLMTAQEKSFDGDVVFAMVPTLARSLEDWPHFDFMVADEAHHSVANTWTEAVHKVQETNPDVRILGFTATPSRGDKVGLCTLFDNVADQNLPRRACRIRTFGKAPYVCH